MSTQADLIAGATDALCAALGDGLSPEDIAAITSDPVLAGLVIDMMAHAWRDAMDDDAEGRGMDPAVCRAVYAEQLRFSCLASLAELCP